MHAVLHHLETNVRRCFGHGDRALLRRLCLVLAAHGDQVDNEQHQYHRQNDAEIHVQLLTDVHTPAFLAYSFGSKRNCSVSVVSCEPVSKRHFLTASRTALAKTGCPPTTFASFTVPFAA